MIVGINWTNKKLVDSYMSAMDMSTALMMPKNWTGRSLPLAYEG